MTSSPGAASSQLTVVRPVARRGGYARTVRGGRSVTATVFSKLNFRYMKDIS